jgi:mannose-6-phosphate isomerase-like protein (cupin superfamily)
MLEIRRVVTGFDENGKSVIISDGEPPRTEKLPSMPDSVMSELWALDGPAVIPAGPDITPTMSSFVPIAGQVRIKTWTLPPDSQAPKDLDLAEVNREIAEYWPGFEMDPKNPGVHMTDTIDVNTVLSGQLTLHTDGGDVATIGPGDSVVQLGTRHWWTNDGDEICVIQTVLIGATRNSGDA